MENDTFLVIKSNIATSLYMCTFFPSAISLAQEANKDSGPLLKDFKAKLQTPEFKTRVDNLKERVGNFAVSFPLPGYEDW